MTRLAYQQSTRLGVATSPRARPSVRIGLLLAGMISVIAGAQESPTPTSETTSADSTPVIEAAPTNNVASAESPLPAAPITAPSPVAIPAMPLSGKFYAIPSPKQVAVATGDGFQLSFVDTDIATVVSTVLGDGLNLPYVVDPQIKGTITLQAARPLNRDELLAALEAALRVQNAALVEINGVMNVVPIKDAAKRISNLRLPGQNSPGFGIYIVPLQYVGVADMEKILQPFAPDSGVLRVDASRNMLLLAGTTQEISTMLNVIATFDVDWLAGMSFAMYPVENVDAKTIATELGNVFSDSKSPISGMVKFVPMTRLNSLMVVTSQEKYLKEVEKWIKQLDVSIATPGQRIYVYDVQNGKADDLAKSISNILSINSSSSSTATDTTSDRYTSGASRTGTMSSSALSTSTPAVVTSSTTSPNRPETDTGSIKIVPNAENNSLLIMASPSDYSMIETTLKRLDVVPIQVLIEASIAEVTLTDDLRFGIQWSYQSKSGPVVLSNSAGGTINQSFPGLSFLYTGRTNISAVLNSLESLTKVRVLSSPKLLVINNHEAQLQIGDQVPIATQSAVSTTTSTAPIVNSVQLHDTGVILRVTPRANKSGRIMLEVAQEVSNVVPTTTSAIDSPTIQQRKISSVVSVENGETIALGGMIKESVSKSRGGVPILSRIPLIGALFGSTDNSKTRTELIILLTPRIIRSTQEADAATQELQSEFKDLKRVIPMVRKNLVKPVVPGDAANQIPATP